MKKVVFLAAVVFLMGIFFVGCNQEEIKKLNEQVSALTQERDGLKAKEAELTKARDDLQNQLNTVKAENEQYKQQCPQAEQKKEEPKKAAAPEKKEGKKEAKKAEPKKAEPAAPAQEKKPKFKAAPAKAK